ncbi:DUF4097 family beta strand repeat-containing protein [Ornithinimicrobium avium]|uniref:Adhesin domain-containing protein n=1 Tax=Ornithinimicrobium avium TaxID=2283195 RepID=A0A345NR45_9MICO|nr:DUF4097 family beta strand repeat-containing protein [Ornithinimicrobium avium]AXH97503.1 hypothetical protein DV701_16535 [Ornithinimicrobium avium]
MSTQIIPTSHDFTGCTSVVVRNHHGDVALTHRAAGAPGGPDDGLATVRLLHRDDVHPTGITVRVDDGVLLVDVPSQAVGSDGRRRGFSLGPLTIGTGTGHLVDVEVEVPGGVPVEASTKFGTITVVGTSGETRVRSGAGDVRVDRCLRLTASTGAGALRVGSCTGGSATTGTGTVTVDSSEGALHVRAGAGDVRVRESSGGEVTGSTGAGDIFVGLLSGSCQCKTGVGDVTVTVPRGEPVWLDLNAGLGSVRQDIEPVGAPAEGQPHLRVHARTGLGDVTVRHP